ncbi:P-loop NTPase fold protein [Aliivibrio sp. EL58]|uniref:KAP family P-loop NTPase fold protein n=1 Tax=Aliivibrio sp. EL58 TaxID=2107582 RepID=UPI000EFCE528|nr:P-loop NTPase fold protein [Aliivibrio sp. EL58]
MPTHHYRFNWEDNITSTYGEILPADKLDRARYAEFITKFLIYENSDDGYVLNLNAQWGAGKTYFLKRWIHELSDKHPVVYIDAWKQDFSNDPLLTVMASIIEQLKKLLPESEQAINDFGSKAARFFKAVAPAVAKGIFKKVSGIDTDVITIPTDEEPSEDSDSFDGSIASALASELVSDHNQKLEDVEHLKEELKLWVEAINALDNSLTCPAFIFVDELDRCRPTYAVEMLEVIKHFFNVKNVVFVVATDTDQLQHAIKAIYGEGFDATTYLGRFFKRRLSLNQVSNLAFIESYLEKRTAGDLFHGTNIWPNINNAASLTSAITSVADTFVLSLRESEQLCDRALAVFRNVGNKSFDAYLLLTLLVLHDKYHSIYKSWLDTAFRIDTALKQKTFNMNSHDEELLKNSVIWFSTNTWGDIYPAMPPQSSFSKSININIIELLSYSNSHYSKDVSHAIKRDLAVKYQEQNITDIAEKHKIGIISDTLELNANKNDYKNWVELAVTFD